MFLDNEECTSLSNNDDVNAVCQNTEGSYTCTFKTSQLKTKHLTQFRNTLFTLSWLPYLVTKSHCQNVTKWFRQWKMKIRNALKPLSNCVSVKLQRKGKTWWISNSELFIQFEESFIDFVLEFVTKNEDTSILALILNLSLNYF